MDDPAHAFDFWIGEWEVHDPQGNHVGRNSISALYGKGALAEHWRGDTGVEGRSISSYDGERGCWHQTWVDSTGGLLLLDGSFRAGAMTLEGVEAQARQRITWTVERDGVRQHWETSEDSGATWTTAFDGRYSRA